MDLEYSCFFDNCICNTNITISTAALNSSFVDKRSAYDANSTLSCHSVSYKEPPKLLLTLIRFLHHVPCGISVNKLLHSAQVLSTRLGHHSLALGTALNFNNGMLLPFIRVAAL